VAFVLLAGAGFTVAAYRTWPPADRLGLFLLALVLSQTAISLHNDYCDRELDAATKPWRAIPSGLLSPRAVLVGACGLFLAGFLIAVLLGLAVAGLVALGTGAGFAYNGWLKRSGWSWLPFWLAFPTLPIESFAIAGRYELSLGLLYLIGAPLAFAVHLADTLPDLEADRAHGVRGFAHRLGPRRARLACWGSLLAAQVLAFMFWPSGHRPEPLFVLSVVLLASCVVIGRGQSTRRSHALLAMASATALAAGWLIALP
jgi:4-hydroxybenzoate polyprenyltransferase